jgi:subtilisin family serine protease
VATPKVVGDEQVPVMVPTPTIQTPTIQTPIIPTVTVAAHAPTASAPVVIAAAKPAPAAGVVGSLATRLLGLNPESPLGWGMLAAARGETGRYRRVGTSLVAGAATAAAAPVTGAPAAPPPFAADEVLLAWKPGATPIGRAQAMASVKATVVERLGTQKMRETDQGVVYRLKVPGGTSAAIQALSKNPNIAFVEPNYRVTGTAAISPNDPSYTSGALWGMNSDDTPTAYGPSGTTNAFGSGAEEAWAQGYTGSRTVVVAVLDEGIQLTHPDLAANIWTNPGEVAGDGVDNDLNGYVDDVNGWDFLYNDKTVYHDGEDAHGTHVAGTIGAVGGNGTGVAGVNWNVGIIPMKFLGPQGGYTSDAVEALYYLVDTKTRTNANIVAVNNSWGGGGYSSALHGAILRAAKADILFVAAAGNATTNTDATANWPSNYSTLQGTASESAASYESVISVASITSTGALSSFSNYGATTVDIGAPGSGILSTVPSSYATYNGTSMAAPHVTGALALYKSYSPTTNAASLRAAILNNAKATTSLAGRTVTGGRLSLEGLFAGVTPPPVVSTYDPRLAGIAAPLSVTPNRSSNISITVGNNGNTGAQVSVALAASGGSTGPSTTLFVPAGGTATTVIAWKAPKTKGPYNLTATARLVSVTLVDANPGNNSASIAVTVR